jgi:signal transduction histidine kinase
MCGFAAGMAHEIKNPLSGVLQSCQNVVRRLSPELPANRETAESLDLDLVQVRRYLEKRHIPAFLDAIREAGDRANRIVADMLSFSRGSSRELIPVRVEEMLETVVRLAGSDYDLKKKYDFKHIEILRDFDRDLDPVPCDRTEIEQVLLNLVKNAAEAMIDADSPLPHRITLRTGREDDYACIEVEDNGPGMDDKTRGRIFEPFFTTKPVGRGTGLGLSVSYFIITEQHRGSISVFAKPGRGTCFSVRLPLCGR